MPRSAPDEDDPVEQLRARLEQAQKDNLDLRHKLLVSRDQAIGAEAEAAQWRLRYEQSAAHAGWTYSSLPWRAGRVIVHLMAKVFRRQ